MFAFAAHGQASISHTLVSPRFGLDLFSPMNFQKEGEMSLVRERYGEAQASWGMAAEHVESTRILRNARDSHSPKIPQFLF
jgi:hypothetical protein